MYYHLTRGGIAGLYCKGATPRSPRRPWFPRGVGAPKGTAVYGNEALSSCFLMLYLIPQVLPSAAAKRFVVWDAEGWLPLKRVRCIRPCQRSAALTEQETQ